MWVTEEQAKGKKCPMGNPNQSANIRAFCNASECMLWEKEKVSRHGEPSRGYCRLGGEQKEPH